LVSQTLITSALRLIGIIRTGQTAAATENAEGLAALNDLLDNWSTERLDLLNVATSTPYTLTSGTGSYTIGPSGTLTGGARPNRIESATCNIATPGGSGVQEYPVAIASRKQWVGIKEKGAGGPVVQILYFDRAFPLSTIKVWPVPNAAGITLTLYTWSVLASFPDLVTDVPLAQGYSRALQFTLAIELCGRFGVAIPDSVKASAADAMAGLRSLNAEMEEPPANTPAGAKQ
jgi:hypothetical protein